MKRIILTTYTTRLATISLMALVMTSAFAGEAANRHRRTVSGQQDTTNYRLSKVNRRSQPVDNGKRFAGNGPASNNRNLPRTRTETRVTRAVTGPGRQNMRQDRGRDSGRLAWGDRVRRDSARRERHSGVRIYVNNRFDGYRNRTNRYIPLTYRGLRYYYRNGSYYRYNSFGFGLVGNPIGFFLYSLPFGYHTLMVGGYPYYYVNHCYYIWDNIRNVYVQVDDPYQSVDWDEDADASAVPQKLIVYPKLGQSDKQMKQDQYECYLWAVDQTGFDPSLGKPGELQEYQRAKSACLEGRGYVVN